MYTYNAKVINVVDGDTFDLEVDLGFNICHKIRVRLLDIDTPESRSKDLQEKKLGLKCTELARKFWLNKDVVIKSIKEKDINTDSFGRYLVYISYGNIDAVKLYNYYGLNKKNNSYNPENILSLNELEECFI